MTRAERTAPAFPTMLALIVLGFACARFSTSLGMAGGLASHSPAWIAVKLAKAPVYLLLAYLFRQRDFRQDIRTLVYVAAGLLAVVEALFCAMRFGGVQDVSLSLFYIATSGANDALTLFIFSLLMALTGKGVICLFAGSAAIHLGALATGGLAPTALAAVELVARVAGTAVMVWCALHVDAIASAGTQTGRTPSAPSVRSLLILAGVGLALGTVTGFYLSLPFPPESVLVANNAAKSLLALLCVGLLAAYLLAPQAFADGRVVYAALAVCLVSCLLIPVAIGPDQVRPVAVGMRLGQQLGALCIWALAIELAQQDHCKGALALGVVLAGSTYYLGTPLAAVWGEAAVSSEAVLTYSAVIGAVLLAVCTAAVAFATRQGRPTSGSEAGPLGEQLARFDAQLLAFIDRHGLSEREAQALTETVHGRSIESAGNKLGLSREAVKFALLKVYAKAGVSGKQELVEAIEEVPLEKIGSSGGSGTPKNGPRN